MFYKISKRIIDIIASLILALLFLPIWIILPILIKLDSPGPIFYKPERVGQGGEPFNMLKFRSMRMFKVDGELVHAVNYWKKDKKLYEKYKKQGWKLGLDEDPRITKLGKIIRQTSLDETPQVFNILMGEMSIVGPRAYVQKELDDAIKRYGKKIKAYINESLTVKPGLTGPWQVSGRNDIPWDERVQIDARYANERNIINDFLIILRTPLAMISKW